jgi:nucleoid-associated protein
MTTQIVAATLHHLVKQAQTIGSNSVISKPRDSELSKDEKLNSLCGNLMSLYNTKANSVGTLGIDPTAHQFPLHLKAYTSGETNFLQFSLAALKRIEIEMSSVNFSTGGFVLFLRYSVDAQDFLFVAMLKLKLGQGIDAETLDLTENLNIDLQNLHEAARINLSRWGRGEQPYLTFIKGRARNDSVSEYFRDALACTGYTDSKHHTKQLLQAANDFVDARQDLSVEQKTEEQQAMRQRLFDCFDANRVEVPLTTVAAAIIPSAPEDFVAFVKSKDNSDSGYHIDERFKPDRNEYIKLKRIKGKIGTISLAFDVADVQAERIYYSVKDDTVIIVSPPNELKTAIQENAPKP